MPVEILRAGARAQGLSVEAWAAQLDVQAEAPAAPTAAQLAQQARDELTRQRRRQFERARAKDERKRETAKREAERRARFLAVSRRRGCELLPNDVPRVAREIAARTMRGEASAARELRRLRRAPFGAAVEVAALAMESLPDGTRRPTRSLRRRRARRVVAVAAVLFYLGQVTRKPGARLITEGWSRGMLAGLFRNDDTCDVVHVNTLFSTMTDGARRGRWDCGAVVALERARAIEKVQPPAHTQRPRFVGVGRDGKPRALNLYYVRGEAFDDEPQAIEARALDDWAAWLASAESRRRPRGPP